MSETEHSDDVLDANQIVDQAAALAAHLQRWGVEFFPRGRAEQVAELAKRFALPEPVANSTASAPPRAEPAVSPTVRSRPAKTSESPTAIRPTKRTESVASFTAAKGSYPGEPLPIAQRESELEALSQQVASCTRCPILSSCRTQTVFGEGSATPRFVFFGEGPGADEDRSGRPFVGKAGQLLTKMIEACKFKREDAYILNTVKCRPPGNRNPEPEEIENCRSFYQRQLELLRPEYIVCLGAISGQELLKTKLSVGRLRGKLHTYLDSKVLVTYHPAYLLRNPAAKKAAWDDLRLMLSDAGIDV